jgi:hypothetical protein
MGRVWDGLFKSMKQNAGNFLNILNEIDKYGKDKVLKGDVHLIR